ncbi:uncharacterized protein LOC122087268 isoform X2 [Macadamia integrifolia]|uniref:uncharacterized protein LOC122087268 isoform X2 n=1 Tax=Macadamia integrifolia TaxID=60698 RepID=UPI001C4FCA6D|nr:uncharacterized protein LOC122087268 isoform X2 [Macadamia integrifolia]
MPVSGYEEPGSRPLGRYSSDSVAGVPIKKRRFPFVLPQSPPSQTESPQAVEPDLSEKEQSNLKAASSPNAGDAREVSGISGTTWSYSLEEKVSCGSGAEKGDKQEVAVANKSVSANIPGNIELQLAQNAATTLGMVVEASGKDKLAMDDDSNLLKSPGNTKLLLVPMEPMVAVTESQNNQGSCGKQELINPCSWNLASAEAETETDVKNKSNVAKSTIIGTLSCANRSNWDLNTMMDTWEGFMNDVATSYKLGGVDGLGGAASHDSKPVMSSAGMAFRESESTRVTTRKYIPDREKSTLHSFSNLHNQQPMSDDLLNLCLSPSSLQSSFTREQSCMQRKVDSKGVETNLRLSESLVSPFIKSNLMGCSTVKSEPFDEVNRQDFKVASASSVKLPNIQIIKSEPLENYSQESLKLLNLSNMRLQDHEFVSSEPVYGSSQEILKAVQEIPRQLEQATCTATVPLSGDRLHSLEIPTCSMETQCTGGMSHPVESHTSLVGFPTGVDVSRQSDFPSYMKETHVKEEDVTPEACENLGGVNTGVASESVVGFPTGVDVSRQSDFPSCMKETHVKEEDVTPEACENLGGVNTGVASESVVGFPTGVDVSRQSDFPSCMKETHVKEEDVTPEACENLGGVNTGVASESVVPNSKEANTGVVMGAASETKGSAGVDLNSSRLRLTHEQLQCGEEAESDEEKINFSADMLEDDPYDTDYESDGNHSPGVMDVEDKQAEDDDYEDGEVREPLVHKGDVCDEREKEHIDYGESENMDSGICNDNVTTSIGDGRGAKVEEPVESENAFCDGVYDSSLLDKRNDQDMDKVATSQEPLGVEAPPAVSAKKGTIRAARRKSPNRLGKEDCSKGHEAVLTSDHAPSAGQGTASGDIQIDAFSQQEHVMVAEPGEMNHLVLPKVEPSKDGAEATKDADNRGGTKNRVINLVQASNGSSSSKVIAIPGKSLPLRTEKERYSDVVLRGDKIPSRGNRDEGYMDGSRKFERERNQDQEVRNYGSHFMRRRGRVENRLNTVHGDWDSDRSFGSEHYNGPTGFRLPRSKNAAVVAAAKLECSGFIVAPDGTVVGPGRGGRKPLNDELPGFRHPLSRRPSPGGRGGPGTHVVRRLPRDVSPDRCTGAGGHDLDGSRREENFMRGMPDDILDPVFSRSQPQYEQLDPFLMGERSFSPIQRRGPPHVPQIRSKSPPRSRSPGPWSSPRRSPDGFGGHLAMTRHRSPLVYRMDRIRSPHQHPGNFADDMVGRRHGSPLYMPRPDEMREIGSSREHDYPRPFISNRSPSGRVLPRNNRRFDMIDPRERTETEEYFGGPMQSSRFHELGSEGSVDERRKCNERHGPVRSFRPPYNGTDVENIRFHFEDGPRPYRFCPEAETDFHERGGLREREFGSRLKSRAGNAHRKMSVIGEQEENYRRGGEGWNNGGFDDVARAKRRRF